MSTTPSPLPNPVLERLAEPRPLVSVELRPPKAGLSAAESMDTWIDMYHSVQRLARQDTMIFLTDNAVGVSEEENLRHLVTNLAGDVSTSKVVPFLTCKHTLDYCLMYADRAVSHGFPALTILGGDRNVGPPRCVDYAYQLRRRLRDRHPTLTLGGWANPHRDPVEQVGFLMDEHFTAEFFLSQIVSHHQLDAVEAFLAEGERRGLTLPGVFGVFLYRSANEATLRRLAQFFPVPVEGVLRDFASGLSAEEICARTVVELRRLGISRVYLSNLGFKRPEQRFRTLLKMMPEE